MIALSRLPFSMYPILMSSTKKYLLTLNSHLQFECKSLKLNLEFHCHLARLNHLLISA